MRLNSLQFVNNLEGVKLSGVIETANVDCVYGLASDGYRKRLNAAEESPSQRVTGRILHHVAELTWLSP